MRGRAITETTDGAWSYLERHANRILAAGGLVTVNLAVLEVVRHMTDDSRIFSLLAIGLAAAMFLLLHRLVVRMVRAAVRTARLQSRMSRELMEAVERFAGEGAGVRGTIEALCGAASRVGCEVWVWERTESTLWVPQEGRRVALTAAVARRMGEGMRLRKPIVVHDVGVVAAVPPGVACSDDGARALVAVPMWAGEELIGMVVRRYSTAVEMARSGELPLVSGLAAIGAVAIGKALVVDREQQRVRDNELLLRSVRLAGETADRDHLADYALQAAESIGSSRCAIYAITGGQLRLVGAHGIPRAVALVSRRLGVRTSFVSAVRVADPGRPVCLSVADADDASRMALEQLGFAGRVVVMPVHDSRGLLGMMLLDGADTNGGSSRNQLGEREAALLSALSRQVSLTVERMRMMRAITKRSRHLACTPKLARSLTGQRDPVSVARIASRELHEGFGFGRVSVALRDEQGDLRIVASAGMLARSSEPVRCTDVMREVYSTARPYVSCAGDVDGTSAPTRLDDENAPAGCRSQLVVPISNGEHACVGVVCVYERDPDVLGEDDLHILETIADQLSGTLEQAELFETLERSYFKTVEALSAALEAKDAYTLDHARSITELSAAVGRRLGMEEAEIRDLKLGALLHDIGKIGVPGEILNKPGPLTDAEFEVMKEHTVIGEQIIAPIEFLEGVRPLVLHEHERWDGRGYPHRLSGDEIPLGARIIFVCDAWHAMTSDRPYRSALAFDEAQRRMVEAAGSQFDPQVVDAFFDVMESEGEELLLAASAAVAGTTSIRG